MSGGNTFRTTISVEGKGWARNINSNGIVQPRSSLNNNVRFSTGQITTCIKEGCRYTVVCIFRGVWLVNPKHKTSPW